MPNGEDKKLNFVAKVYDPVTKTYRPIYIAPDATNAIQGDVYLTDIVDDTKNAQDGMTAITPAGVKKEIDRLNRVIESSNPYLNATVGSTIKPIYLDSGTFKEIIGLDGSMITSGTISLERLPQGALERLVTVENKEGRLALTRDRIQTGDVVQQLDTKVMYVVVDDTKLDQEEGYVEFAAGLATKALEADHAGVSDKLGIVDVGDSSHPFYLEKGVPRPITKVANAVVADQLGTTTVGDEKHPIYIRDGIATQISKVANAEVSDKLGTANIGSAIIPIFLANGVATASTASVGNANDPMRLVDGTLTTITKVNASNRADRLVTNLAANEQDLNNYFGDDYYNRTFYAGGGNSVANKPAGVGAFGLLVVRIAAGWTLQILQDQNTDDYYIRRGNNVVTGWNAWRKGATVAAKLGEANVGDATHPIYLNGGTPTRIDKVANAVVSDKLTTGTIGDTTHGVYINAGVATKVDKVANAAVSDKLTTNTVGGPNKGIYLNAGVPTPCSGGAGGMNVAGTELSSSATVSDNTASTGKLIQVATSTSNTDIASKEFDIPFGLYSVIVRAKCTQSSGSNSLFSIVAYAGGTQLSKVTVKESDFSASNTWVSLGVGVDYKGTVGQKLKITLRRDTYSGSGVLSIDYISVIAAPVAINALT